MAIEIDETTAVEISTDDGTTWIEIGDLTNVSVNHGRDEPTLRRVFGTATPYSSTGERNDSYSFNGLYDTADAGQTAAMAQLETGDLIMLRVLVDGTNGESQSVRLTQYDYTGDAEGDFWEVSIAATGVGAITAVP